MEENVKGFTNFWKMREGSRRKKNVETTMLISKINHPATGCDVNDRPRGEAAELGVKCLESWFHFLLSMRPCLSSLIHRAKMVLTVPVWRRCCEVLSQYVHSTEHNDGAP